VHYRQHLAHHEDHIVSKAWRVGDCVRIPDGRIARVREVTGGKLRVRVRRTTSATHQFLMFATKDLKRAQCPKGWMSPEGYARYLRITLAKMRQRQAASKRLQ
jgi:hypothetical protein